MHQMSRILRLMIALVLIATAALVAGPRPALAVGGAVIIDPSDTTTNPAANLGQWGPINVRNGGSVALTCDNPRNGDGSIAFGSPSGNAKADFANYWGVVAGRTLGNLSAFSYEWYRDSSSTNPAVQVPALRLSYLTQAGESGYLIYEPVYNDYPGGAPTNSWTSSNAFVGNFWMRAFGPGRTIDDYNISLAEWIANADEEGSPIDDDQDGDVPHVLSANTIITGVEVGVGSGWNGVFTGHADTIRIAFGAGDDTTWNFEGACAPTTGSLKVTKVVNLDGITPPNPGQQFTICITGPSYPTGDCKTVGIAGGDLTWGDLTPGSYSFSENTPPAEWATAYAPASQSVAVVAGQQATATITNKLCCLYADRISLTRQGTRVTSTVSVIYSDGERSGNIAVTAEWTLPNGTKLVRTARTGTGGTVRFSIQSAPGTTAFRILNISDAPNAATPYCPDRGVTQASIQL